MIGDWINRFKNWINHFECGESFRAWPDYSKRWMNRFNIRMYQMKVGWTALNVGCTVSKRGCNDRSIKKIGACRLSLPPVLQRYQSLHCLMQPFPCITFYDHKAYTGMQYNIFIDVEEVCTHFRLRMLA